MAISKNIQALLTKLTAIGDALKAVYKEREEEIDGLLIALLARQHVLLLGPPGTGKSALTRTLCEAVDGGEYFQWLLTKFSTPEELFGPMSLKALENDEFRRITSGKMPEAHITFLDEIFKANSAILNSLLTLINEREFHNNGAAKSCPLLSCIGASNELPKDETLGALYDRFILRYWVEPLTGHDSMKAVYLMANEPAISEKITLDELGELQDQVAKIKVSDDAIETFLEVKRELEASGFTGSDRRWRHALRLVRATALYHGREEVKASDMMILGNAMWTTPDQRPMLKDKVGETASPLLALSLRTLDNAKGEHRKLLALAGNPIEFASAAVDTCAELKDMIATLKEEKRSVGGDTSDVDRVINEIEQLRADATRRLTTAVG